METLTPLLDDPASSEIIVVDDGYDDAATRFVRSLNNPRVQAVCIPNSGRSLARQVGLEQATAPVVILLDDDVIAAPGLVTGHVALAEPGKIVVGYMPTPAPRHRTARFATRGYSRHYEAHCRSWASDPASILDHFWGGNSSMMRADALRVGIHHPAFDARYHDDYEFGIRCRQAGLRAIFAPELRAVHNHALTAQQFLANARKQGHDWPIIHRLHPELGPYDFDRTCDGKAGTFIRFTRRPRAYGLVKALSPLAALEPAANVLARVEHQQGALRLHQGLPAR